VIDFNKKINQKIKWEGSYIINGKNYTKDLNISITLGANPILLGIPFLVSLIIAVEVIQSTSL
jgi:hypothetical protein